MYITVDVQFIRIAHPNVVGELYLLLFGWRLIWNNVIGPNHKTSSFTIWEFLQTFKTLTIDG
jgi:hypothetical protein